MEIKEKILDNTTRNNDDVLNDIINAKVESIQEKINECNSKIEEEIVNLGHAVYAAIDWGEYEEGMGIHAFGRSFGYISGAVLRGLFGAMEEFEETDAIPAEKVVDEICKRIHNYKEEIKNYEKKIEEIKNINNILNLG